MGFRRGATGDSKPEGRRCDPDPKTQDRWSHWDLREPSRTQGRRQISQDDGRGQVRGHSLGLMKHLNEEFGVTFVFATHDPKVMEAAKRVVWLEDGQVHEDRRK